jgi:ADP-heptose:LPS heptosyltransferase
MQRILCLHFSALSCALNSVQKIRAIQIANPRAEIHLYTLPESADVFTLLLDHSAIHCKKPSEISFDLVYDLSPESTSFWTRVGLGSWPKKWNELVSLDFVCHFPSFDVASKGVSGKYIVYALSGEFVTQVLDYPHMVKLVDKINVPIVLIGNAWDENFAYRLHKIFPEKVFNLCKDYSYLDMVGILKGASLVITHDSPLLEIAQVLQKKTFAIFGASTPNLPIHDGLVVENKGLACRPCQPKMRNYCPLNHFKCMTDIDLSPIIHATQTL